MIGEILEFRRLLKNQKLSSDDLVELQNRKLRAVIRHAYENVPYYRSLFSSVGLTPDDIRTGEDLKRIPITTKDDMRASGVERTVADGVKISSCQQVRTSGSTGKPFATYLNRRELRTRRLLQFRALLSVGFRSWDRLAVLGPQQPHQTLLHQRLGFYRSGNISPFLSIENQIKRLQGLCPTVFWAYPTMLRALLHRMDYRLSKFIRPRMLITSSEVFEDGIRRRILADLDVGMFNFYGANEVGRIASECAAHEGLHVDADHVILECVENERTEEMRKAGVTVITALNAFTMPLIRYHLGDNL
jgi:phenylacetate-CoA ligase